MRTRAWLRTAAIVMTEMTMTSTLVMMVMSWKRFYGSDWPSRTKIAWLLLPTIPTELSRFLSHHYISSYSPPSNPHRLPTRRPNHTIQRNGKKTTENRSGETKRNEEWRCKNPHKARQRE